MPIQTTIRYVDTVEGITPEQVEGFFEGWLGAPSPETHLRILENSTKVVLAMDEETDVVVGFITAVSDRVLAAYIPLLEVLPEYRSHGIGQELLRRMLDCLGELYAVDLMCDEELQPFYDRFGMRRAIGMMIRRYEYQSGRGVAA